MCAATRAAVLAACALVIPVPHAAAATASLGMLLEASDRTEGTCRACEDVHLLQMGMHRRGNSSSGEGPGNSSSGAGRFSAVERWRSARAAAKRREGSRQKSHTSPLAGCDGIECVKRYVALPDDHYSWTDTGYRLHGVDNVSSVNWTGYVLNVTSQAWWTEAEVDFPVWWHTLVVVVPANLQVADWATLSLEFGINFPEGMINIFNRRSAASFGLVVDGENLDGSLDILETAVWRAARLATHTRSIGASLFNALNEPETFGDDPLHLKRTQDLIKAYTWEDFMRSGASEPERIMELPVAKSVVRAMDAIAAFTAAELPSGGVARFGVWGYSKLGMATWMAGAVDPRVEAIAPMNLLQDVFDDHRRLLHLGTGGALLQDPVDDLYGFLVDWYGTPEHLKLDHIVDFLNWLPDVTVAKLVVMDTDDAWFTTALADIAEWWPAAPEPKSLLVVEAEHDTTVVPSAEAVTAFFHAHILGVAAPRVGYSFNQSTGRLAVNQLDAHVPTSVVLHSAVTCRTKAKAVGSFAEPRESPTPDFRAAEWALAPVACVGGSPCTAWAADLRAEPAPGPNCSKGGFVRLSYRITAEITDTFAMTTPIFVVGH